MVRRVVGSFVTPVVEHWLERKIAQSVYHEGFMVDPLSYFPFQPVLHDWCNKGCGMSYPVCGIVRIKYPLLLIGKSSLCGGSGFPRYLNGPLP